MTALFQNPEFGPLLVQFGEIVEIGLDTEQFKEDMASDAVKKRIDADRAQAAKLAVTGTPAFFVNGRFLSGAQPFDRFKVIIDEELEVN